MTAARPPDSVKARLLFVSLAVLVVDQWSKWLVEGNLDHFTTHEIIPGLLNLIHVTNTGVAFGFFQTDGDLLGAVLLTLAGIGALAFVSVYYWRTPSSNVLLLTSLSLVLGGAIGNLADRMMQGFVTDFIDVYVGTHHWPTFNVADSAISVGIVLMAFEALRPRSRVTASEEAA